MQSSTHQKLHLAGRIAYRLGRTGPPIRGKGYVALRGLASLVPEWPDDCKVLANDGTRFLHCDLHHHIYRSLHILGVHEPDVQWMLGRLLREGDTAIDIGANFGYHTVHAAARVGKSGRVWAIEPQADMYALLSENLAVNGAANVTADCLALSDSRGTLALHRYQSRGPACTSMAHLGDEPFETIHCPMDTLDHYLAGHGVDSVTLIKLDVEGAELAVLKGAEDLLSRPVPPMWIVEVNFETSEACGYHPNELLSLLRSHGYVFYRPVMGKWIREVRGLERTDAVSHGDNILAAVEGAHSDRLRMAGLK